LPFNDGVLILPIKKLKMKIGIDAIAFDVAKIHLPIKTLALARNIEPEKLEKGLGLIKMTLPDTHQDTVVFGANALTKLILDNNIKLDEIARIYVGTESAIDNSKPISSFLISLMEQKFGEDTLSKCDVVDFTFACIGGVDALQNCIDFVQLNPTKKAIVVTTDFAKYDLNSTGEYTQGAGSLAMLVSANPRIIAFENHWGVSTKGVFDFFNLTEQFQNKKSQEIRITNLGLIIWKAKLKSTKTNPFLTVNIQTNAIWIEPKRLIFHSKNQKTPKRLFTILGKVS
jgi:3-hydroxy-3-methylglutaryl CoA synthase